LQGWEGRVGTYGGSGVGTEGKGSSTRAAVDVVVGDEVHMVNEWWARPSTEGQPDYSSRVSTEKGLGLDEKVSKKKKTMYLKPNSRNRQ